MSAELTIDNAGRVTLPKTLRLELHLEMDALAIGSFLLLKSENAKVSENRVSFAEAVVSV